MLATYKANECKAARLAILIARQFDFPGNASGPAKDLLDGALICSEVDVAHDHTPAAEVQSLTTKLPNPERALGVRAGNLVGTAKRRRAERRA